MAYECSETIARPSKIVISLSKINPHNKNDISVEKRTGDYKKIIHYFLYPRGSTSSGVKVDRNQIYMKIHHLSISSI